ncbi:putative membrane protein YfcA [Streptomyces sp. SAI-144]|uniref:sulfite exporter TauE/SafE family protein n=1 Tax=unclassified Streptomyces TaxID=2593676 RepID=UPI002475E4D1|nr:MULTISPECIES: sulfite exporter TauE/SafE family protein [unclassified Streptomyces]MDH6437815.1 putative membrane protein YfcA [Streptomyces sp. SAI-144]MDH6485234.1 putative membrane protein YfcA [Streptomyces sp. SAI-127]
MSALVLALLAGGLTGLALGALGGGGSMLAVPAMIYLLGFSPAAATTAALVVVTLTSVTALVTHARGGAVRWREGALFAAAGLVPAAIGGAVSGRLPAGVLTAAFAVVAALAAVRMLRPSASVRPDGVPVRTSRVARAGAGLGAVTGVLGVGGGFLAVPALVNVIGLRMRAAVGTSLLVITVNSLTALAARAGTSVDVDWGAVAPFAATAVLGAWDGRRLAAKVSAGALQRTFAVALLAVAAFMLADAVL